MQKSLPVLLISAALLTGCGESRLNPLNWFGRGREAPVAENTNPLIPQRGVFQSRDETYRGALVGEIRDLKIERLPGGAIARVTGLADTQGPFDVKLVALNDGQPVDRVLSFELRALKTPGARIGTERSRLLTAAVFLTDQDLTGIREIKVLGARNAYSSRR